MSNFLKPMFVTISVTDLSESDKSYDLSLSLQKDDQPFTNM